MTSTYCNCRACVIRRRAEAYGLEKDLLPSQDELMDLPDYLGTDYGEPQLEPTLDD